MNAPGTFLHITNKIFFDMLDKILVVYLDGIQIFTKTKAEHKQISAEVFHRLAHYSLFVREENCTIFFLYVEFLGHIVISLGISVQPGKVSAIKNWPQLRSVTKVLLFLGLCNYYHRYIFGYAKVAAPLTDLLRGNPSAIYISDVLGQAFLELKNRLVLALVLKVYDPELPVRVLSNVSKLAVGAILE